MKTIIANAFEFGVDQFGDISAHVILMDQDKAREILDLQAKLHEMAASVVYIAVRADNHPLDNFDKDLEELVGQEMADEFYDGENNYIVVDGDPFGLARGTLETDLILVFRDVIVSRFENSETGDITKALKEVAMP
jgi:hypothetical protein